MKDGEKDKDWKGELDIWEFLVNFAEREKI